MDPEIVAHLMEIKGTLGRIEAKGDATHEYVSSVSRNHKELRDDFKAHVASLDAHGASAVEKRDGKWVAVISLAVSIAVALWKVVEGKFSGQAH